MTFLSQTTLANGSIRIKIGRSVTVLKTGAEADAFICGAKIAREILVKETDVPAKPDCALCGQPYHRHNIGSITTCPIIATYRPRPPAADAGEVRERVVEWTEDEVRQSIRNSIENGSTGALFARTIGVQKSHLYEFLNGTRGPGNDLLHKIGLRWAIVTNEAHQEEGAALPQAPSPTFADGVEAAVKVAGRPILELAREMDISPKATESPCQWERRVRLAAIRGLTS